jgi:PIN domain nuclease of toxin-antitoxin system
MTRAVLDASALIAALEHEPGGDRVEAVLGASAMTTVNLTEVVTYFVRLGVSEAGVRSALANVETERIVFDEELAYDAGLLLPLTRAAGLSLGDRCCLALARRLKARAVTADRAWRRIAGHVGVEIEVIR